ncbi:unnamed protein product [Calypogeia fissa]
MSIMDSDYSIPFFNGGDTKSWDLRASMTPAASIEVPSQESGGRNLPFKIVYVSGQDEDHPASELNKGIQGRGWQSSRFCFYPQELVLQLQWPSRIINMQLLCHEFKIPSKVEVFVSLVSPWIHNEKAISQMKRLGYLSLDPNDRSGHQARELKSIHVDSPAAVVRLVLHHCYSNKLNVYNQVGLVALITTGDPLEDTENSHVKKQDFSPLLHTPRMQMPCTDATLNAVDTFTATRIERLQQEKLIAIQEEDYDEAKRLKTLIDKLKGLGEQIKQLELQKRAAVEAEDYDAAKICKAEIDILRKCDGVLAESLCCSNDNQACSSKSEEHLRNQDSSIQRQESFKNSGKENWTQTPEESARASVQSDNSTTLSRRPENGNQTFAHDGHDSKVIQEQKQNRGVPFSHQDNAANGQADQYHASTSNSTLSSQKEASFSQPRDIPPESTNEDHHELVHHITQPPSKTNVRSSFAVPQQLPMQMSSSGDDLNAPEPLSDAVKAECGPLLNLLDLYHVQCLYSKQWQLRDKAFQFIAKMLQSEGLGGDSSSFRIFDSVLIRALNDRVPNVFYGGLQLLKAYIVKYSGEISARDLQHSSTKLINILLDKLGDSNIRSKDAAAETLMFMASKKELGLDVVAKPLLRPAKNQAIWKPVLGRLNWLLVAIPAFGVQPQSRQGFSSETLMSYVSHAINNPNGEVRNASVKVTTEVYKIMGATVERYLKGIKPMIREVLLNNFERVALETRNTDGALTYDELENIPIPRRPRKAIYDIEKALDDDIQKAMSLEAQTLPAYESQVLTQPMKKGKQVKDGALLNMVVEQQENPEVLQTMYSTEATALVDNFPLSHREELSASCKKADTEEAILTHPWVLLQNCEPQQSHQLDVGIDGSFEPRSDPIKDCTDDDLQTEKDDLSDQCLFCGKQDSKFLEEDNLDLHFCQKCPMLVGCCNCKQIVEIASLKDHYLRECTSGRRYLECSKCSQAIPAVRMTVHLKSKECRSGKHYKASRCPLCHHAVQPGDVGWRDHLLKPPGCPKNPRTLLSL